MKSPSRWARLGAPGVLPARAPKVIADAIDEGLAALGPPGAWPAAAQRELQGHLTELGLSASVERPLEHLAMAELTLAQAWGADPSPHEMARAITRATRAQALSAMPHGALFGFTRMLDARFSLTPKMVEAMVRDAVAEAGSEGALFSAIDRPPASGAAVSRRPSSRIELTASLVRQLALGDGASLQLDITADLAEWLRRVARSCDAAFAESMGGAGAFGANVAAALGNIRPRFFSRERLPARVAAAFAGHVERIGPGAERCPAQDFGDAQAQARINFSCEYRLGVPFTLLGRELIEVNGVARRVAPGGTGRVILGTPTDFEPGFGHLSPAALRQLGQEHQLFFVAGIHYFTKGEAGVSQAERLAEQLAAMKAANPSLVRHHQYVVPKVEQTEAKVLSALRGHLESLSLNAVELPGLLARLAAAGLGTAPHIKDGDRAAAETVRNVVEGAAQLRRVLQLPRVHIHAAAGDLVIQGAQPDPERTALSHLRARQVGSMKAANDSGQIRDAVDLWPIAPLVTGQGLAGLHAFAQALRERFRLPTEQAHAILESWHWHDPKDGSGWFFVPTRGIHDDTGGKVSLGDALDVVPLLLRAL